jgi:hypothetical protein
VTGTVSATMASSCPRPVGCRRNARLPCAAEVARDAQTDGQGIPATIGAVVEHVPSGWDPWPR